MRYLIGLIFDVLHHSIAAPFLAMFYVGIGLTVVGAWVLQRLDYVVELDKEQR